MTLGDCDALEALMDGAGGVNPRAELAGELTQAWVACEAPSGRVLGYALGWWVIDEFQLLALGTLPAERRRGAARALLAHIIAATGAAGGRRVSLEVGRNNTAAVRLYESAGFRVFNVRRAYYRKSQEDALEMERCIPNPA
jgi:ribosomal protein S18 acetylase RimI-like enzyme